MLLLLPSGLLELPPPSQRVEIWASVLLGQEIWGHGVLWCCPRCLTHCPHSSSNPHGQGEISSLSPHPRGQTAWGISHPYLHPAAFLLLFSPPSCWESSWVGQQAGSHGQPDKAGCESAQRCCGGAQNDLRRFLWA